jgi:hypothetical protein
MRGILLLTWVLMGTVSTLQCHGTACQPTRTSQVVAGPHRMAVFQSLASCEVYRQAMQQTHQPVVVPSQSHPDVTVRKAMTFTCQEREDPL